MTSSRRRGSTINNAWQAHSSCLVAVVAKQGPPQGCKITKQLLVLSNPLHRCLWALKLTFPILVSDSVSSSAPLGCHQRGAVVQTAGGLEAGVTQSIVGNIGKKPACSRGPRATAASVPGTQGNMLTGFTFFIPKYGPRGKDNVRLYSANRLWMPGHSCMFFDGNFCRFFPT